MTSFIDKQFEANLNANLELIAVCATLTDEQLAVEVEGIFGRIKPLIAHIVSATAMPCAIYLALTFGQLILIGII